MKKLNNKGFTLVEMLACMSLIVLISSLGFVKVGDIKEKANEKADIVTARNLISAGELYLLDNDKDSLNIDNLELKGYISEIPTPKSKSGDFTVKYDDSKGKVVVCIDGKDFFEQVASN